MYKYWGFGLRILSALAMPELMPLAFDEADVTITFGNVPETLEGEQVTKRLFSTLNNCEYILEIKNTCRYYAGHGKNIVVEPVEGADKDSIKLFLLGTVIAAILYQRGNIPLHASAIVKDGKLTLFTGNSGAGKSTLLAYLSTKGYQVFTDDICVVQLDQDTKTLHGTASYPMIKLWDDALMKIGNDSFGREHKIRPQLPKYGQYFHHAFQTDALPIEKVFILHSSNDSTEISYTQLNTLTAFKRIEKQAYRYRLATGEMLRPIHFGLMSALVNQVPVIEMKRPSSGTSLQEFSDLVETLL